MPAGSKHKVGTEPWRRAPGQLGPEPISLLLGDPKLESQKKGLSAGPSRGVWSTEEGELEQNVNVLKVCFQSSLSCIRFQSGGSSMSEQLKGQVHRPCVRLRG